MIIERHCYVHPQADLTSSDPAELTKLESSPDEPGLVGLEGRPRGCFSAAGV